MLMVIELVLCLYEVLRVNRHVTHFYHLPCMNGICLFVNKSHIKLCARALSLSLFPGTNNTAPRSSLMLVCLFASLL